MTTELDSWPPAWAPSDPVPIWEADFRPLALGNPGALPGDLTFARQLGGRSVQTSAATVLAEGPGGFGSTDEPRVGQPRGADSRGLCLEDVALNMCESNDFVDTFNVNADGRDVESATQYPIAPGSATFSAGTGSPLGSGTAKHVALLSGGFGRGKAGSNAGGDPGSGTESLTLSAWFKPTTAVQFIMAVGNGSGGFVRQAGVDLTGGDTWRRVAATLTGIDPAWVPPGGRSFRYLDARDHTASGGIAAQAQSSEVDLVQLEAGRVATNWIPADPDAGEFVRQRERLTHPDRADLIAGGRFCFEAVFCPEGGPTDYGVDRNVIQSVPTTFSELHVWFVDANNRAFVDVATGEVHAVVGGTDHTLTPALSWAVGQMVDLYLAIGNGVPEGAYRISSDDGASWGAPIALAGGSAQAAIGTSGAIDLFCRQGVDTFSSYINVLRAFDNEAPAWAA